MDMSDPSIAGAAQALAEHLRSMFPSVPFDTICAITTQHASDPHKCWDLVRLESSRPTSTESSATNYSNGGSNITREGGTSERHYAWVPAPLVRARGSYVIRRSQDSPSFHPGANVRDNRSCTPPRAPSAAGQQPLNPPMATYGQMTRPESLDIHSVLQHRSLSTSGRLPSMSAEVVHSCPGTPTGSGHSAPRTSIGFGGNMPSLKINYQTNGSQITLSPSPAPNSPTLVVSSQSGMGGGRPVYYQFSRTPSQGLVGVASPASSFQYVRRPSYADVEMAQRSTGQQSPSPLASLNAPSRDALRVSAENLSDGSASSPVSPYSATSSAQSSVQTPPSLRSSSPNIRISVDPRSGGAIITSDTGATGARIRPRVTFTPMVGIQPNYPRQTFTFSVRQPSPVYDSSTLVKTAAITNAQAEECLKSVLAHQRSRLTDMKKAMTTARQRLDELRMDVDSMEQDLTRHRKHSVTSAAISDEAMSSLHRETRELQAEIQMMFKEMELHRLNSGKQKALVVDVESGKPIVGGAGVCSADQLSLDLKTKNSPKDCGDAPAEAEQWSCTLCTFRNHVDLPICECCEMPRVTDVDVDGWQLVYDLSPSVFK